MDRGKRPPADPMKLVEFVFGRAGLGGNNSRGDNHTDEREADHEFVH